MFDPVECLRLASLDFPPLQDCSHALCLPQDDAPPGTVMILSLFGEIGQWPNGKPSRAFVTVFLDASDMVKPTAQLMAEIKPMIEGQRQKQREEFTAMLKEQNVI